LETEKQAGWDLPSRNDAPTSSQWYRPHYSIEPETNFEKSIKRLTENKKGKGRFDTSNVANRLVLKNSNTQGQLRNSLPLRTMQAGSIPWNI